ncbi:MAG: hypothetical protein E5X92_11405 [Mesorhizobium sp.]|nr:MAG: hypothetical protein E5X92_11405 [Mesorhizobium sp.]
MPEASCPFRCSDFWSTHGAAPHPYPLPVKDGERGPPAFELVPSSRPSRGEGAGRRMRGGADVKT